MPTESFNARELRRIAEETVGPLVDEGHYFEAERPDLETSLVRQWITYEGHATLFVRERQIYLDLDRTPLGKPYPTVEPAPTDWVDWLTGDWKLDPDELPEDQLRALQPRPKAARLTNSPRIFRCGYRSTR